MRLFGRFFGRLTGNSIVDDLFGRRLDPEYLQEQRETFRRAWIEAEPLTAVPVPDGLSFRDTARIIAEVEEQRLTGSGDNDVT